jgi:hypothetical protein
VSVFLYRLVSSAPSFYFEGGVVFKDCFLGSISDEILVWSWGFGAWSNWPQAAYRLILFPAQEPASR